MKQNVQLKIEKGIPIPPQRGWQWDILRKLKKGDSVLLPCSDAAARNNAAQVIGKGKYAVRREGTGARVWRIK